MSEPEIAKRCRSCGAAVRARATFCPQCGMPQNSVTPDAAPAAEPQAGARRGDQMAQTMPSAELPARDAGESPPPESTSRRELNVTRAAQGDGAAARGAIPSEEATLRFARPEADAPPARVPPLTESTAEPVPAETSRPPASGQAGRVTAVGGDMPGTGGAAVRARGERLRQASNVVLDEAAVDPSLRFVLVAALLVVVSLLLFLLSRVVG